MMTVDSEHFDDVDYILQSFDLKPLLPSLRLYSENKALLEVQRQMIGEFDLLMFIVGSKT